MTTLFRRTTPESPRAVKLPSEAADAVLHGSDLGADVYPVHLLDNANVNHSLASFVMRFNDVLDPKTLSDSLSKLLEIGDWRKLGGRLRFRKDGKFEVHVPKCFSLDDPGFVFTRNDLGAMKVGEHDAAARFPKPTNGPSIQPLSDDLHLFLAREDFPKTIKLMIQQDLPQLSLHVTSFSDATLVAVSWPQTLMDAMGLQALLKSWSAVMGGREADVPSMLGARTDLLFDAQDLKGEFALNKHRLKGRSKIRFGLQFIRDKIRNSTPEMRTIFLPKSSLDRLQMGIERQATEPKHSTEEDRLVGQSDILTAWAARAVASAELGPRAVTIGGLLDARPKIPRFATAKGVHVQNILTTTSVTIPAEMATGELEPIARLHNRHLLEQSTELQVRGWLSAMEEELKGAGDGLLLFGPSDAVPMLVNDLTDADYIQVVDFQGAVMRQGEATESRWNPPGTMVMNYHQPLNKSPVWPNCFYILGKDHGGNRWLMGSLTPQVWDKLEAELEILQEDN